MRTEIWSDEEFGEKEKEKTKEKHSNAYLYSCFCQKFAFTNPLEKVLLFIGISCAAVAGACLPIVILLLSDLVAIFIRYQLKNEDGNEKKYENPFKAWADDLRFMFLKDFPTYYDGKNLGEISEWCAIKTALLGVIVFFLTFGYALILNFVAGQQIRRIRLRYFTALVNLSSECTMSYSEIFFNAQKNLQYFYQSVGDNFGTLVFSTSTFISSLTIAFFSHSTLSGLLMIVFPLLCLIMFFGSMVFRYFIATEKNHYSIAENLARDIFLNIHTVKAYEGEFVELRRYDKLLETSQQAGINTKFFAGVVAGLVYVLLYTSYALTFWQGISMALLPNSNGETPNVLIIVNFCMQICYVNILKIPIFVCFTRKAADAYGNIMERINEERILTNKKILDFHILTDITYNSVSFDYSDSSDKPLLHNVNIRIPPTTLTVLVGPPKTGKTTLLKLLLKLLKPNAGSVQIGKWNVNDLNNFWLRNRIGYVQQNTVLFGRTIRETLEMCCTGKADRTENEMINVCRIVNAHSYVTTLPQGYDTILNSNLPDEVLEKLAIARVLMRNPDVLILDDCMDNINRFAQMAFITDFQLQGNKTVIVVTNNLEIIRSSDQIFLFKDGKVETETFNRLINKMTPTDDKLIPNFESDLTDISKCHGDVRERKYLGMDPNELISKGITTSSLPNFNKFLLGKKKDLRFPEKKINSWKILTLNRREFPYLITASVAAVILGFSIPAYALLFGESLGSLILHSVEEIEDSLQFFPQMFIVAGFISGIARLVEGYMIAISCSKLTKRLRKNTMDAIIQQDTPFFDKEENNLKYLLRLLRVDTRLVPFGGAVDLIIFVKIFAIILMSAAFALYTSWKLGLVVLGFSPFLFYALHYLSKFQSSEVDDPKFTESNALVEELFKTGETIQVLNLTELFMNHYKLALSRTNSPWREKLVAKSLLFGYSHSMQFFAYAVCMFYGGMLLQQNEITFTTFFKIIEALILGTLLVGQVLIVVPSRRQCEKSLSKLLNLDPYCFERSRTILRSRFEMPNWIVTGFVKMRHLRFTHPYQRLAPEIRDVNLQINDNQMVIALTGNINSGHSIPIALLVQFYRSTSGSILVDDFEINREFSGRTLRRCIGYVDGKDRFLRRTVARNIAYGTFNTLEGYEAYVGMDEVINAAKEADIHNFISTLSEGYSTLMTDDVCKRMTPGQVLRLSLARALLRDPKILLITNIGIEVDEDAQQLMESAISKACFMRTAILASHHLQSVSNIADCIYFFKNGRIKEFGKHQKLMEKKGAYFRLFEEQEEQMKNLRQQHYFLF